MDGKAIVYCEKAFGTTTGKTAHGLARGTDRYEVLAIIDSCRAGKDAGVVLDSKPSGLPIIASLEEGLTKNPTHFVIGLAPDGGRLPEEGRQAVKRALLSGLHVDSGLHDFLAEDPELSEIAKRKSVRIRDVRKTPPRHELRSFTGRIEEIRALRLAVLGTDSALGKRTTARILTKALQNSGKKAEMIGTGQTAWMQGTEFGIILDSLINDFVAGELENAVLNAWDKKRPDFIVIEGQGSLMNPAYPGGLEILAATRPHAIILQHAPARKEYDGFPGFALHPLEEQIEALSLLSKKPVIVLTLNHENLTPEQTMREIESIEKRLGIPTTDVLLQGPEKLVRIVEQFQKSQK